MECAAAVFVLEKASPALVAASNNLFRTLRSVGFCFKNSTLLKIIVIASIAYSVDFSFAFLFQMDSKLWLNASNMVIIEISIGSDTVKLPSKMAMLG